MASDRVLFFERPQQWRRWLERHHGDMGELWVGFHKKASGRPSMTWPEAVDEALCFGWIDGVRQRIDEISYKIRFTPRKASSSWSSVNVRRAEELADLGLMRPAGLEAFRRRSDARSGIYSYEQRMDPKLPSAYQKELKSDEKAWEFFRSQPPSYRRAAAWWVISAKREDTRRKRLKKLIEDSTHGRAIRQLTRPSAAG